MRFEMIRYQAADKKLLAVFQKILALPRGTRAGTWSFFCVGSSGILNSLQQRFFSTLRYGCLALLIVFGLGACAYVQDVPQQDAEYVEVPYTDQVSSQTVQGLEEQYPPGYWDNQILSSGDSPSVAVKEFSSPFQPGLGLVLADMVASALINSRQVTVVEREQIAALLNELEFSQSGLAATPAGYETGQMHTVDFVITGNIHQIGNRQRMEAKLLDVLSGQVLASETLTVDQVNAAAANALAGMLLGKIRQK